MGSPFFWWCAPHGRTLMGENPVVSRSERAKRNCTRVTECGFWILREGVHVVMTNGKRILTIPYNDPVHGITMEGIVRDAGLTPGWVGDRRHTP